MTRQPWARFEKGMGDLAQDFYNALDNSDKFEASMIASRFPAQRKHVDFSLATYRGKDDAVLRVHPLKLPTAEEYARDLALVEQASAVRDKPLSEVTDKDLPNATEHELHSLTRVSWFLQSLQVKGYEAGVDHVPDEAMLTGQVPAKPNARKAAAPILTGRDAATYVHDDDPMRQWTDVLKILLRLDCPRSRGIAHGISQGDFACWGYPYLAGALGEVLRRTGIISFKQKWKYRAARPETAGITQVFPEGSPMHGDVNAMHHLAASAMSQFILRVFDDKFELPNGNTLEYEVNLMERNISQFRLWAGVHTSFGNSCGAAQGEAMAKRIYNELVK